MAMGRLRPPIIPENLSALRTHTVFGSLSAALIFISSWRLRDSPSWRAIILREP